MPRYTWDTRERTLVGAALAVEARTRGLSETDALVAAANTTGPELRALVQQYLQGLRTERTTALAGLDAQTATTRAALQGEIAAIDSALAKI